MANEAALRVRLEDPIDFTCANTDAFEKGAFVKIYDPRIASGSEIVLKNCAGIVAREKIASDGRTQVAVYRRGIFDVHASGAINAGDAVAMAESNDVIAAPVSASGAQIIGSAMETAADNETFQIYLNIQ